MSERYAGHLVHGQVFSAIDSMCSSKQNILCVQMHKVQRYKRNLSKIGILDIHIRDKSDRFKKRVLFDVVTSGSTLEK